MSADCLAWRTGGMGGLILSAWVPLFALGTMDSFSSDADSRYARRLVTDTESPLRRGGWPARTVAFGLVSCRCGLQETRVHQKRGRICLSAWVSCSPSGPRNAGSSKSGSGRMRPWPGGGPGRCTCGWPARPSDISNDRIPANSRDTRGTLMTPRPDQCTSPAALRVRNRRPPVGHELRACWDSAGSDLVTLGSSQRRPMNPTTTRY